MEKRFSLHRSISVLRSRFDVFIHVLAILTLIIPNFSLQTKAFAASNEVQRDEQQPVSTPVDETAHQRPTIARPQPRTGDRPNGGALTSEQAVSSPLMFIENVGQFDSRARFMLPGRNSSIYLTEDGLWFTALEAPDQTINDPKLRSENPFENIPEDETRKGVTVKLSFVGANSHPILEPFNPLETRVSYLKGKDPNQWHADVPVWSGVRYIDLYPGVDLDINGETGSWSWKIIGQDAEKISQVQMKVDGAESISRDEYTLNMATSIGNFEFPLLEAEALDGISIPGEETSLPDNQILTSPFKSSPSESNIKTLHAGPSSESSMMTQQDSTSGSLSTLLYSNFLGGICMIPTLQSMQMGKLI